MTRRRNIFSFLPVLRGRPAFSGLIAKIAAALIIAVTGPLRAQEQVVVGYDGFAGFQGAIWATKDLGLFEKYGLNGELILIPGSARGMAALLSGSAPFIQGSATAPLSAFLRGGDVTIVAAAYNKLPLSVVVRKEIRNPADLVGKKLGILNFGGSNDLGVTLALKEWNIPRSAVTILVAGGAPERLAALLSGNIDATVLSPPETVSAARAGMRILANLGDLKASFPQTLIMVRRSYLASKRETVKRFVRAYSEGIYEFKNNRDKAVKIYASRLKQKDLTLLEETHAFYAPKFSWPPRIDRGGISNTLDLVRQTSEVKGEPNLGPLVDESLIDELEREGFYKNFVDAKSKK
jgi:NitT/TauT family transport system substrate-binding protein